MKHGISTLQVRRRRDSVQILDINTERLSDPAAEHLCVYLKKGKRNEIDRSLIVKQKKI